MAKNDVKNGTTTTEEMGTTIRATDIFRLYVKELGGRIEREDEKLVVRLEHLVADTQLAIERIRQEPTMSVRLVRDLSTTIQELDAEAGAAAQLHEAHSQALRWALLLPEVAEEVLV